MKKKGGIIIIIIALFLIAFAFFSSDVGSNFFTNYGVNFKKNVNSIFKTLNITLPRGWQDFLDDVPQEPQTEYDLLKQEYEEQQKEIEKQKQEEENQADQQSKKDNEEYNATNIEHTGKNIALENASSARYARFLDGILCARETTLTLYSDKGEKKWSHHIQISSPVLKIAEDYALLFEKDGKKFTVYHGSKNVYSGSVNGTIKTASISSGGDSVIVFDRDGYKGSIAVYNKSGDEVYLWNSGKYSILDADISPSRRLAASLLDPSDNLSSKIYFFDISKSDVDDSISLEDAIAFDIAFDQSILNVFTDNKVMGISSGADEKWSYDSKEKNITKYSMSPGGTKVVVFDNKNSSEITLLSAGGSQKNIITSEVLPDVADISDSRLLYNAGRTLILTNLSGEVLSKYTCSRDIKKAYIINSDNIFIVYNSSIEFLNVKG